MTAIKEMYYLCYDGYGHWFISKGTQPPRSAVEIDGVYEDKHEAFQALEQKLEENE